MVRNCVKENGKYGKGLVKEDKFSAAFKKLIQNEWDKKHFRLNKTAHSVICEGIENTSFLLCQVGS